MSQWSERGDQYDMSHTPQREGNWWTNLSWWWKFIIIASIIRGVMMALSRYMGIGF